MGSATVGDTVVREVKFEDAQGFLQEYRANIQPGWKITLGRSSLISSQKVLISSAEMPVSFSAHSGVEGNRKVSSLGSPVTHFLTNPLSEYSSFKI